MSRKKLCKTEVDLRRLLSRCEAIFKQEANGWRLGKYVEHLQGQLNELKTTKGELSPSAQSLTEYGRRVNILKGLLEASKQSSVEKQLRTTEFLAPSQPAMSQPSPQHQASKEIHLAATLQYDNDLRKELMSAPAASAAQENGELRRRNADKKSPSDDFDVVIKHEHEMQEKFAEELISLVGSFKENQTMAGHVIRKDNRALEGMNDTASGNVEKLKVESDRLASHTKSRFSCTIWLLLFFVGVVFLWMVVFIRIVPKQVS